ncbi:M42 family metallopeptidase [Deinococcus peraridilitoris]|uniref:Peptidase family protein n=1 Tax=Deinococcus peraridilitoris (strain DSM 19664 / LMG 22246 / CIP 109416 / KR-200) TaxID=937777 RepID=L0A3R2_DEIPD|nr:M42 family metallopeptidase [Deinococcus peraridilitoris]AFZ67827.1 peptidase family protein [Deinococcus peraridilitoris DSM 19664]
MTQLNLDLLRRLSEIDGVPGREEHARDLVRTEIEGLVDELREDALGNLIALKRGTAPEGERLRVMLSAHLDEIGFMVKFIDDQGYLRLQNLGGFDTRNLFARNVKVWTNGGELPGILTPGGRPVHIASAEDRKKVPELREFFVDLGLGAEEVRRRVRVGDSVTLDQAFREVGDLATGKAMDDRASVFVQIEALRALQDTPPRHDVYAVFSTQEEVGLRGAVVAAYSVEPDLGVALDVTLAVDTPGVGPDEAVSKAGEGVGIKLFDGSMISTRFLVDEMIALAEANGIPYQLEVLPLGGTDAGAIQRSRGGVPSVTLSLPTRYIHTVVESVHKKDLQATLDLLVAYLKH